MNNCWAAILSIILRRMPAGRHRARDRSRGAQCVALPLVLLALAAAGLARADAVDTLISTAMREQHIPGVALLVMRPGQRPRMSTYGLANVELQVPVKRDTVFETGSLGKQFTAAGMLLLVQRHRISLSDPISKYLPGDSPAWPSITVRELLDHTSGLHDSEEDGGEIFDLRREYSDEEIIKILRSYPLDFPPGSRWKYSNSGYILAGIIVTRLTGIFYGDFLTREVFGPLNMRTTRVISNTDIIPNRAAGYVRTATGIRNQDFASASLNATGDGSLVMSLDDWAAWIEAMNNDALLSRQSWADLWDSGRTRDGKLTGHGFCWDPISLAGHQVIEFDGSWLGFRSAIERDPGTGTTVVVMANLAQAKPLPIARAVLILAAGFGRH